MAKATDSFEQLGDAVRSGNVAEVRAILAGHPELKMKLDDAIPGGSFGSVAIQSAVEQNNREMIDALLDAGASIQGRSHWWAGSFGVFDNARDAEMVDFLTSRGAAMDPHDAARWGRLEILTRLVENDPRAVHFRGGDGQTPLHVAANVEIARFLLDHGADIDALDVDHESTPAQYLIKDHPEVVEFLIERGCRTDIMMVTALGDLARIDAMLNRNPDAIRTTVTDEYFPMKNPKAGGTIYNWTLDRYATLLQVARISSKRIPPARSRDVIELLNARAPDDLKLVDACERGDAALARKLILADPDRAQKLPEALQRRIVDWAQGSHTTVVRLMLESGWPVDARGQHQGTALHWAAFHGNIEMVKLLLDHGAPTDLRDADFDGTPLSWARYGSENSWLAAKGDYPSTIELLERQEGSGRIIP
ncbi:MAG TPA: ankyrin repeat domain-containing protein [Gemmatimonadales bacterium]|jgi:ankyrin repeat protein